MANSATRLIRDKSEINSAFNWADPLICRALNGGAVLMTLGREGEPRNNEQNKKGWALWTDISKQLEWYGEKLEPEDWKDLLSNEWGKQRLVPGISGGFCALGVRTSKMKKRPFSELVEITYAFGSEKGVRWSEPAIEAYNQYREAGQ